MIPSITKQEKLNTPYQVKSNLASYKEIDEGNRTVKAIVNTYNYYDFDYDVLRMGAAKQSIEQRGSNTSANDKILHALFHDLTRLPGKSMNEVETVIDGKQVLYAESKLSETIDGEDTLTKYIDNIYNQHSIGFKYIQIEYIEKEGEGWNKFINSLINPEDADKIGFGWDVKEFNWYEWSTVPFGANKLTPALGVKTTNKTVLIDNIYLKLQSLVDKANRYEVKDKRKFELQYAQLKQMILELTQVEQSQKDILRHEQSLELDNTDNQQEGIDYKTLSNNY